MTNSDPRSSAGSKSAPADLVERLRQWSNYDDPPGVTLGDLLDEAATEIAQMRSDMEKLSDPVAVHINMLRGGIAKPSWPNIKHLYPEQFGDIERERDEARQLVIEANNSLYGSQGYFHSLDGGPFDKYHLSRGIENLKAANRHTFTPAQAVGMRQALEDTRGALEALQFAVEASGKLNDRGYIPLGIQVNNALDKAGAALAAPVQCSSADNAGGPSASEVQVSYDLAREDGDLTAVTVCRVFENGFKVLLQLQGEDAIAFIDAWNARGGVAKCSTGNPTAWRVWWVSLNTARTELFEDHAAATRKAAETGGCIIPLFSHPPQGARK